MTKSDHEKVIDAVKERFYEHGKLSKRSDITDRTGLSKHKAKEIIEQLLGDQLVEIYEGGGGNPAIYATVEMFNAITSLVGEPEWIEDYEFEEKSQLRDEVKESNEKISDYQVFELMLHAQGSPLEDGIEKGLEALGFEPETTEDAEDFFFEYDRQFYVAEAKGKGGPVSKGNINQLGGWIESKIDEGYSGSNLHGVIFHNAYCDEPSADRGDPLTDKAKEFLSVYKFEHISTYEIFKLVEEIVEFEDDEDEKEKLIKSNQEDFVGRITNG